MNCVIIQYLTNRVLALYFDNLQKRHLVFKSNATVFDRVAGVALSAPSSRLRKVSNVEKLWELQ